MTDDVFHLTPLDVRRFEFPSALRGYDKARVDEFREQVADEMERLTRQMNELDAKAKSFHEQLRAFRERDKALNEALVSAQQLRGELREQADKEAALIIREAQAEAQQLIEAARSEARSINADMESLERSRRTYLAQLKALTERQLAEIEAAFGLMFGPDGGARARPEGAPPREADDQHATPVWLKSLVEE
jgi:DivIVA domain-containing protein